MLSFKSAFSLSSFMLIKRLFSSSSLSAMRRAKGRNKTHIHRLWMDGQKVVSTYNGTSFPLYKERNLTHAYNTDEPWRHPKWNKPDTTGKRCVIPFTKGTKYLKAWRQVAWTSRQRGTATEWLAEVQIWKIKHFQRCSVVGLHSVNVLNALNTLRTVNTGRSILCIF